MSIIATACKHLIAAGVTGDALLAAIAEMEADLATLGVMGAAAGGRVYSANPDSVRKRLYRWRRSGQMGHMSHHVPDVPPVSHGVDAAAGTEKPRNSDVALVAGAGRMWEVHHNAAPVAGHCGTSGTDVPLKESSPQTPLKENISTHAQGWARVDARVDARGGRSGDAEPAATLPRGKRKGRRRASASGAAELPYGSSRGAVPIRFEHPGESEFCARVRRALAVELGDGTYRGWIDPCAVVIHDGWLSIIAATRVHGEHIGNNLIGRIRPVAGRFGLKVEIRQDDMRRRAAG